MAEERPGFAPALAEDPVELARSPFRVHRPDFRSAPFVFASPHSGRAYPRNFVAESRLSFTALRRSEDAYVEELFLPTVEQGAVLLAAAFPRAYVDVNRAPAEFDAAMFERPLDFPVDSTSPRVNAGLGVIPRIVREGAEIYRKKLSAEEANRRLTAFYQPYHAALSELAEETFCRFGTVVVVDCHSMPSAATQPDIVLGDRYGTSAASTLTQWAHDALERQGFAVGRNVPYAGGYTTQLHGRPALQRHALQIEINRSLYLDEEVVHPSSRFPELGSRLSAALRDLLARDLSCLAAPKQAAE